jgi:DNA-binding transcriptional LysR family regulator
LRAGLFQALERKGVRRNVAVSVTHFLAVPEIVAVTDHCATLPRLVCRHLAKDARLKVIPAPVDLGTFPVELGWHVRYRDDPAHRWLRSTIVAMAKELSGSVAEGGVAAAK